MSFVWIIKPVACFTYTLIFTNGVKVTLFKASRLTCISKADRVLDAPLAVTKFKRLSGDRVLVEWAPVTVLILAASLELDWACGQWCPGLSIAEENKVLKKKKPSEIRVLQCVKD